MTVPSEIEALRNHNSLVLFRHSKTLREEQPKADEPEGLWFAVKHSVTCILGKPRSQHWEDDEARDVLTKSSE